MVSKKERFFSKNQEVISQLAQTFSSYPNGITKNSIQAYLSQFKDDDLGLGLKILENVDYYDPTRMMNLCRQLGTTIHALNGSNFNNVILCPISPSSGDSSEGIKRNLKLTMNGRSNPKLSTENFTNVVTDLSNEEYTDDTKFKRIVLIDHFIGSGDTIIGMWGAIQQWENSNYEYNVGVIVGYEDAIQRVEEETASHVNVVSIVTIPSSLRVLNEQNPVFTPDEQSKIKNYCEKLGLPPQHQYGHNNGSSLVVFHNRVPNNVLPILNYGTENWKPIFPRIF